MLCFRLNLFARCSLLIPPEQSRRTETATGSCRGFLPSSLLPPRPLSPLSSSPLCYLSAEQQSGPPHTETDAAGGWKVWRIYPRQSVPFNRLLFSTRAAVFYVWRYFSVKEFIGDPRKYFFSDWHFYFSFQSRQNDSGAAAQVSLDTKLRTDVHSDGGFQCLKWI